MTFEQMGLHPTIQKSLKKYRMVTPTEIQQQAIPSATEGLDILASAPTGTGKTLAFSIPMLTRILNNQANKALIIVPTRELAQQVQLEVNKLLEASQFRSVLIIGGAPIAKQMHQLARDPKIVIGTPGRLIDHINRGTMKSDDINFLVLDEMDRMFDMGFGVQIQEIMQNIAKQRQTLMFTATLPPKVAALAKKYLISPKTISVGTQAKLSENVDRKIIHTSEIQKFDLLVEQLNDREGSVLIFVKTKISADRIASQLIKSKHPAIAMHGDLRPHHRKRAINDFSKGRRRIMVATDIATRGLDIPHIQHVINYDLPNNPEDYIHRVGRTARAGATGHSLCIISPQDKKYWRAINLYIDSDGQKVVSAGPDYSKRKRNSNNNSAPFKRGGSRNAKDGGARGERSEFRGGKSGSRNNRSEFRGGKSDSRGERSEFRGGKSDSRGERSEFRGGKSGARNNRSEFRGGKSDSRGARPSDSRKSSRPQGANSNRKPNDRTSRARVGK